MTNCPTEERIAIEDLAIAYCAAVDAIGHAEDVAALFTEDAIYDLDGIGLGRKEGKVEVEAFFAAVFPTMAHNAHFLSNFTVRSYSGTTATATAYVHAFSNGVDGSNMDIKAAYTFGVRKEGAGWRICRLSLALLLPPAA